MAAPRGRGIAARLRSIIAQREKARTGQLGGGAAGGHCAGYTGTPPPPLGPPGPWRPPVQHFLAGMPCGGLGFGFGWQVGQGGGGSDGAALTCAVPPASVAMPTPTAIRAAAAKRLASISVLLPDLHHGDEQPPGGWARTHRSSVGRNRRSRRKHAARRITREAPARPQRRFRSPVPLGAAGGAGSRKPAAQPRRCPCTATPESAAG